MSSEAKKQLMACLIFCLAQNGNGEPVWGNLAVCGTCNRYLGNQIDNNWVYPNLSKNA